jgi:hypothetical protein
MSAHDEFPELPSSGMLKGQRDCNDTVRYIAVK